MTSRRKEACDSGMVLVELLAALSILAVMSALMAGLLSQMRTLSRMSSDVKARAELTAAADHLARTISGARNLPLSGTATERSPVLVGTPADLRFSAVTRRSFDTLGLSEVTITSQRGPSGLMLVETLRTATAAGAPAVIVEIVVEGLTTAEFTYVSTDGSVLPDWSAATLPAGVRITLARGHQTREIRTQGFAATD